MENTLICSLIALPLFFGSCKKDSPVPPDDPVKDEDVTGTWNSELITINGVNSSQYAEGLNTSTHLGIEADGNFYRNFVTGTWDLRNDSLILTPNQNQNLHPWNYKVIDVTANTLTIEIHTTEVEYMYDFDEFGSDEVLTFVETYRREE